MLARQAGGALGEAVLAGAVAAVVAGVWLVAFASVAWPAFNSSNVTRALTTVGQVVAVAMLVAAIWLVRARKWPWVAKVLSWGGISTFVTVTLGMPLGATKLYLFGLSVDQEFRTQYLTRLTDGAALRDMNYVDLPPFYPAGWFWAGGRFANLFGLDGWEAFKPWAITALAVAAALALVLWSKLIRADWAIAVAAATTAVTVAYAAPEAYSAVLVVLLPPVLVLAWGALHRPAEYGAVGYRAEFQTEGARTAGGEAAGSRAAGSKAAGSGAAGSDAAGSDPAGSDPAGSDPAGSDPAGSDAAGSDAAGSDAAGSDAAGSGAAGSSAAGSKAAGSSATTSEAAGSGAAGSDAAGSDPAGSGAAGSDAAGSGAAGSDAAGSGAAGSKAAGSGAAGSDAAGSGAVGFEAAGSRAVGSVSTAGGWGAVLGTGLFLGLAATFYTLYFAVAVFAVCLMAVAAAGIALWQRHAALRVHRRTKQEVPGVWRLLRPILVRLIAIGVVAGLLALVVWLPFLLRVLREGFPSSGTAFHYLPEGGARLPLPMFELSLLGGLCLIGVIWLVLRVGSSRRAQALTVGVVAVYLWCLLSMLLTAAGTTLLSFRLEPVLLVLLAAAGAFGFAEGARAIYQVLNEPERFRAVVAAVAVLGAIGFGQQIPEILEPEITTAYTDTDGDGVRADKFPPSAVSYYHEIDAALREQTGRPRDETVVLTADLSFLSIYPYFGFQALTSHYANPLADFPARADEIERWSTLESPEELVEALRTAPWRAPDAFLFRQSGDNYTLRLAEDVYPNQPNVKRYQVTFPAQLFDDPRFTVTDIGPFTVVVVER
ncbi:arabinofuranosyltransferase [Nocardia sp. CC227C]|uniref:arabinofuranosyltransferase n=1 Tax=Nocardia sp. CC227C TaxID=3044562 RepID=UPI00278BDD90|nr:arabinofuranosyltransferase [Nocardia sp. CC227C]